MVLNPSHITHLRAVRNGFAVFGVGPEQDRRYGLIDRNGEIVVEARFRYAGFHKSDRQGTDLRYIKFHLTDSDSSYRLFDTQTGAWIRISSGRCPEPIPGHDGLFLTFRQGLAGIADNGGRQIIPEIYAAIFRIGERFLVQDPRTGKFGIRTSEGETAVPCILAFDRIACDAGKVLVRQAGEWFYVDDCGGRMANRPVIALPDNVLGANLCGDRICYYIPCRKKLRGLDDRACGMLDAFGTELLPPVWFVINRLNGKYFSVGDAETFFCGLADSDGHTMIPADAGVYIWIPIKENESLLVFGADRNGSNLNYGMVRIGPDKEVQEVLPARFVYPHWLLDSEAQGHGCIVLAQNSPMEKVLRCGVFFLNGEQLVPFEYDGILLGDDPERIAVRKGGEWFFINPKNERTLF